MAFAKKEEGVAVIKAANIVRTTVRIAGTAPYVQHRFYKKAELMEAMATPKAAKKGKGERSVREYDQEFADAQHIGPDGWNGIPASAFRAAMIDACRTVGMQMTKAKMAVFIVQDGLDVRDGTPLVRLNAPAPERMDAPVRNDNGSVDIRVRPMWRQWEADVTIEFDADMITAESVLNLLDRAGRQVGVGEGRPYSKSSVGQGWGTFTVIEGK